MLEPILCVGRHHHPGLVVFAVAVSIMATATGIRLRQMGVQGQRRAQGAWLVTSGCVSGAGVWATHFIAMLAFNPGTASGYDLGGTALSLALALAFAVLGGLALLRLSGLARPLAFALVFIVGVGGMHYAGVRAYRVAGVLTYDPVAVAASIILGAVLAGLAAPLIVRRPDPLTFTAATLLMSAAVCVLHFVGMAGLAVVPDLKIPVPQHALPREDMALLVGGLTTAIVIAALVAIMVTIRTRSSALRLLTAAFDAVPHGLAYSDAEDRLVFANQSFLRDTACLGLKAEVGLTFEEIIARGLAHQGKRIAVDRVEAWGRAVIQDREAASSPRIFSLGDGRIFKIFASRTRDGGLVTSAMDISDLERQTADLTLARDVAEAADRVKGEFLANMSHELRTPLNGVMGIADLLLREPATPRQAELLTIIRASALDLERLVGDLLDTERLASGALEIVEAAFDLGQLVAEACEAVRPAARAKGLKMSAAIHPSADLSLLGDGNRLRQVLANLLSNAVKFTSSGSVTVAVDFDGSCARIEVADTGVGFDPSDTERLFRRFEQADGSITRRYGGTGLGLALSKDLAERMGGDIVATGAPGAGARFTVTLPLKRPDAPGAPAEGDGRWQVGDAEGNGAPVVLVVDDNPTNQTVLCLMLEGAGFASRRACDGADALVQWDDTDFYAVLMDMQMPVMDGLTAVREMRAREARTGRRRTSIVMVSANALPVHVDASRAAGADAHVAKPVTVERLFSALQEVIARNDVGCEGEARLALSLGAA